MGLSAPAVAQDEAADAQLVADWRAVYVLVRALHDQVGGPVLLAPVGDGARSAARRTAGLFTAGEIEVRALPTVGDRAAEISLALAAEGLACAAVLTDAPGGWMVEPAGDCSAAAASSDRVALPPRLVIGARKGEPSWQVRTDTGEPVDAWRYSAMTRDDELRDRLITERRRHRVGRALLTTAGTALVVGALVPLTASVFADDQVAEDRRFSALYLALSGGALVVGARLDRRGLDSRQGDVGRYVHPVDAANSIADHNSRAERAERAAQAEPTEAAQDDRP